MIPTECKMPDLSDCSKVKLQATSILHAFIGDPGVSRKEGHYRRNFARLTDKAISEYQLARHAILAQIAEANRPFAVMSATGRYMPILAYVDHFENCANAINRILKLFDCMQNEEILAELSRPLRRSLESSSRSLPPLRNAFEHVDELIQRGELAEGQPVMLSIGDDGDRAVIGAYEVEFVDVARTLRKLHEIGTLLFEPKKDAK